MRRIGAWARAHLRAPLADAVVRALDTRPGETVLEIGCGACEILRRLMAEGHARRIAAIDASAANVDAACRLNREAIWGRSCGC